MPTMYAPQGVISIPSVTNGTLYRPDPVLGSINAAVSDIGNLLAQGFSFSPIFAQSNFSAPYWVRKVGTLLDTTPTVFFDPTATGGTGVGTLANPYYTAAQVQAYLNTTLGGFANGVVLGFKRGTVYRGRFDLTVTGAFNNNNGQPFVITPYGTASTAPQINASTVVTSWVSNGDGTWAYNTGSTTEVDAFQNSQRLWKTNSQAALVAAGPGYAFFTGTTLNIYPIGSVNPNTGAVLEVSIPSLLGSGQYGALSIVVLDTAGVAGNIVVAGLDIRNSRDAGLAIVMPTANNITALDNIQVIGNNFQNIGTDISSGGSYDAILINGASDTKRISNLIVVGNTGNNIVNNAVETSAINGGQIEWNNFSTCSGNGIWEAWSSNSNVTCRYNRSVGWGTVYPGRAPYHQSGIWQPAQILPSPGAAAVATNDPTKNSGNIIDFNTILNSRLVGIELASASGHKMRNNTVLAQYGGAGGSYAVQVGAAIAYQPVAPVQAAAATSATGGTLAAATYFYVVSALNAAGESAKSNEQSIVTTGTTSSNTVNWAAVTGATGYRIYRGTATGAENTYYVVGAVTTFLDTGAAGTAGTPTGVAPVASTIEMSNNAIYAAGLNTGAVLIGQLSGASQVTLTGDNNVYWANAATPAMNSYLPGAGLATNAIALFTSIRAAGGWATVQATIDQNSESCDPRIDPASGRPTLGSICSTRRISSASTTGGVSVDGNGVPLYSNIVGAQQL